MCRNEEGSIRYAPLCIHSFPLITSRKYAEAERLFNQYRSYEGIDRIPDRLKWCRNNMGLTQQKVAERIGITRGSYIDLETGAVDYYDKAIVDKLAKLFGVAAADLLDDYNAFLYSGQGKAIKAYRTQLGLGIKSFARLLHTDANSVRHWEAETKRISKNSWEKCFKNRV